MGFGSRGTVGPKKPKHFRIRWFSLSGSSSQGRRKFVVRKFPQTKERRVTAVPEKRMSMAPSNKVLVPTREIAARFGGRVTRAAQHRRSA